MRVQSHAGLCARWNAVAGLDGGRADLGCEFEGRRPHLFDAGRGYEGASQPRLGPGCAAQDRGRRNGGIALAFSIFKDKAFNGQVFTARSADGGKSFAEPRPITSNNESQRFEALGLDTDGSVFAAWIDKRNRVPAKQEGRKYEGAGAVLRVIERRRRDLFRGAAGNRQHLRMLPARTGVRRPRPSRRRVQEHLRGRRARSRDHDFRIRRRRARSAASATMIGRLPRARIMGQVCRSRPRAPITSPGTPTARRARACSMPTRRTRAAAFPIRCRSAAPTAIRPGLTSLPVRAAPPWSGRSSTARKPQSTP